MNKLNISRHFLPAIAILGMIVALLIVLQSQPDRSLANPPEEPARAPASQTGGSVAGSGVVEPSSELIEVGTPIAGVVDQIFVRTGEQVAKGAPLFVIDSRDARAAAAEAEARAARTRSAVDAARTSLTVAERQFALYRNVTDERAVSQQEVIQRRGVAEDAAARLQVAQAEAREAKAQLDRSQVTLDRLLVRAPIAGQVLQIRTRVGQFATAGPGPGNAADPLVTMGATRPLHVRVDIDENEIDRVDMGQPAIISPRGDAGRRVTARFVRAEPLVIPKKSLTNSSTERVDVRVLQLIFALPAEERRLFVGQQVDAFVPGLAPKAGIAARGAAR